MQSRKGGGERGRIAETSCRYAPDEIDPTKCIKEEQLAKVRSRRRAAGEEWAEGRRADTKATEHVDYRILSKLMT